MSEASKHPKKKKRKRRLPANITELPDSEAMRKIFPKRAIDSSMVLYFGASAKPRSGRMSKVVRRSRMGFKI